MYRVLSQDILVHRDELEMLAESWIVSLRAEGRSPATIKTYSAAVRVFLNWADQQGVEPGLDKPTVRAFIADLIDGGAEMTTVKTRQTGLRRFSAWLLEEREIESDELLGIKAPALGKKVVEPLTNEQITAMIATCADRTFIDRRDEAIIRVAVDAFLRSNAILQMTVSGTDAKRKLAIIAKDKGSVGHVIPFSDQAARSIDRYLRLRRHHRLASTDALWLGDRGASFGYGGLYGALTRRAHMAGVANFHPHRLRHTGASRYLFAGGSEGGAMAIGNWKDRGMLDRYVAATAAQRAAEEFQRLDLGRF